MSAAERIFASFDCVYVLNLPDRADRRAEMAGELARIGTRFDDPRITLFPAIRPAEAAGFPGIGAHGAFLSHLAILRDARDRGHARILILEDDCDFTAGIEALLPPALDMLDRLRLDIFYGGHALPEGLKGAEAHVTPLLLIDRATPVQTAHCIGFGRVAIEGLVPFLEALLARAPGSAEGGPMHVDGAYSWFRASRADLAAGLAMPQLAHQRPSRSDIAPPGPLDRLPATLRKIVRRARRRAKRFSLERKRKGPEASASGPFFTMLCPGDGQPRLALVIA
jgi:glycosyl transferase family 25